MSSNNLSFMTEFPSQVVSTYQEQKPKQVYKLEYKKQTQPKITLDDLFKTDIVKTYSSKTEELKALTEYTGIKKN